MPIPLTQKEKTVFATWQCDVAEHFNHRKWDADMPPQDSPGMKEMQRRYPDMKLSDIRYAISRGHAHALGIGEFYPV